MSTRPIRLLDALPALEGGQEGLGFQPDERAGFGGRVTVCPLRLLRASSPGQVVWLLAVGVSAVERTVVRACCCPTAT